MSNARVKQLKLRNFKSFKKADIPFADGFSAIVGPNGSGKSNLLDALMFVMGITSLKTIRASRLGDLVYHSAPDGMARVTVHLETDTDVGRKEFIISRMIDKEGKSFYRLDGKRTTRNAIHSLLTSLNISPNGYNIVLQGDVERVIEMSPVERRTIIDEVAGIAEYEEKKEEAMKQLDSVQQKIKDWSVIKGERLEVLSGLQNDRDNALKYKDITQRLKQANATILKYQMDSRGKERIEVEKVLAEGGEKIREIEAHVRKVEEQEKELDAKLKEISDKINSSGNEALMILAKKLERIKADVGLKDQAIQSKAEAIEKNNRSAAELKARLQELEKAEKDKHKQMKPLHDSRGALEAKLKALEQEQGVILGTISNADLVKLETDIRGLGSEIDKKQQEFYSLKAEIDTFAKNQEFMRQTQSDYNQQLEELVQKIKELDEEYSDLETQVKKAEYRLPALKDELEELERQEKHANKEFEELDKTLKESREQFITLKTRLQTMKTMSRSSPIAIESVMAAAKDGKLKGVHGPLSDLCSYNVKHSTALETAAGNKMFFIVVNDENSAIHCMNHLRNNKLGRASFIPLNKIRPQITGDKSLENKEGSIGWALDLVTFDRKLAPAFEYVFGNTLLIEDIKHAKDIGVGKAKMVSLDGDVAETSGVMSGGEKEGGKRASLGEVKALQEFEAKVEKQEQAKKLLFKEIEQSRDKGDKLRDERHEIEVKVKELETRKTSLGAQLKELREKSRSEGKFDILEKNELEMQKKQKQMHKLSEELSDLQTERSKLEEKASEHRKTKNSLKLQDLERQVSIVRKELGDSGLKLQELRTEVEQGIIVRKNETLQSLERLEKDSESLKDFVKTLEREIVGLRREQDETEIESKKASKEYDELLTKRESVEKQSRQSSEEKGKLLVRLNSVKNSLNESTIRQAVLAQQLSDLENEFRAYEGVELLKEHVSELTKEVPRLEVQVQGLGNVNMKAIDDYEIYSAKVLETQEKIDTLDKEKEAIMDLVAKIDARRVDAFNESFESVRKNFLETYKILTNGRANLKLQGGEEDLLRAGLLIEAAPEDKKMMHIDALSGGEKTIASMAFLFAIQRHKPAPFYVLDECDAALDKMNSEKLANLFLKYSGNSQFIVITHNEILLKDVDQIVGIAKGDDGTSVVGVRMKEVPLPA